MSNSENLIANSEALNDFEASIKATFHLINALEFNVAATRILIKERYDETKASPEEKKLKKSMDLDQNDEMKLYEVGFIALFANFESFMYSLLKEFLSRYPLSIPKDKTIKIEEILTHDNIDELKKHIIDRVAIENSYEVLLWKDFLSRNYSIDIMLNSSFLKRIKMLNLLRNAYMHSGGKTNSKFSREMGIFLEAKIPLDERISLDRKKYFHSLYNLLTELIASTRARGISKQRKLRRKSRDGNRGTHAITRTS